jgi:hypothetical protein
MLKASLLTGKADQACSELMALVDNSAADQDMCTIATLECLEASSRASPFIPHICWWPGHASAAALLACQRCGWQRS